MGANGTVHLRVVGEPLRLAGFLRNSDQRRSANAASAFPRSLTSQPLGQRIQPSNDLHFAA